MERIEKMENKKYYVLPFGQGKYIENMQQWLGSFGILGIYDNVLELQSFLSDSR